MVNLTTNQDNPQLKKAKEAAEEFIEKGGRYFREVVRYSINAIKDNDENVDVTEVEEAIDAVNDKDMGIMFLREMMFSIEAGSHEDISTLVHLGHPDAIGKDYIDNTLTPAEDHISTAFNKIDGEDK